MIWMNDLFSVLLGELPEWEEMSNYAHFIEKTYKYLTLVKFSSHIFARHVSNLLKRYLNFNLRYLGNQDIMATPSSAVEISKVIRTHPLLKQRQGLIEGLKKPDFFRFKRALRALLSEEYKTAQKKSPYLPEITTPEQATAFFIELIKARLVVPVNKITAEEAREKNLPVEKGFPNLIPVNKAELKPDEYYIWLHDVPNPYALVYGVLFLCVVFGLILFPLWPYKLRLGVWYVSMGCLGLLVAFFGMAIVRLVIFCVLYPILSPGFWLFPNLFADCGFWESFVPLYGWGNEVVDPKTRKLQERKKEKKERERRKLEKKQRELEAKEKPAQKELIQEGEKASGRKVLLEDVDE